VPSARTLIVNADDFGLSVGINRGIEKAHRLGIVTSASVMVRGQAVAEVAAISRANPGLSLGIHLDLAEWTFKDGAWVCLYEVVPVSDRGAVEDEVERQIESFRALLGCWPTHLDSHQHIHLRDSLRAPLDRWAGDLRVPVRGQTPGIRHCGKFYGQTAEGAPLPEFITAGALIRLLSGFTEGATEIACHPAEAVDFDSVYAAERIHELHVLCDPRVRAAITDSGIRLCSFTESGLVGG
jgi:chitin disaccharide deacetylase